jgi:uroporphyrinogen decarboxylase
VTSKRDRLEAALAGDIADRPPFAVWRHFPVDDQSPESLADAVLAFQRELDCDFIKVTPASSYCLRDWGVSDAWQGSTEGTRAYTVRRVEVPADWSSLEPLDPRRGALGEHLRCLADVVRGAAGGCPVLATVFSPLAQAKNLAGGERLLQHLRSAPDDVQAGLDEIARTTVRTLEAAREVGIEGIFYAVQHASPALLDREAYASFALPLDRMILEAAGGLRFNLLHLHGVDIDFDLAASLPVSIVNWHDRETPPTLREGRRRSGKAVCGGLARVESLVLGTPDSVQAEARQALRATDGGRGLILGTGCVVPIHAPRANLLAARRSVEELPAGSRLAAS